jgi:hypothetical protein
MTFVGPWPLTWPGQENTIQKTIIWPLGLRSRFQEGHYGTWHTTLWSCTHIPNIIDKNVMAQTRKYYLKNNSFDLEVKGQGPTKVITVCDTPPYEDAPTYQISLTYLKRNNYLTLRSKVQTVRNSANFFVFPDRSMIFGMWVHDHKAVCRVL